MDGVFSLATTHHKQLSGTFQPKDLLQDGVDFSCEIIELPDAQFGELKRIDAVTHAIIFKREQKHNLPFNVMFGPDFVVDNQAVVALYDAAGGANKFFHCENCAAAVALWLGEQQNVWHQSFLERRGDGPHDRKAQIN